MYKYNEDFYNYINQGALSSAKVLIPELLAVLPNPVRSVLDIGCGAGAWLSVWKSFDCNVIGLDGAYVDRDSLLIDSEEFFEQNLVEPFSLGKKFDLVQCLEVAEHLPATRASSFVAELCKHSELVLFSAATPGQGGENHINEQPYHYWRDLFAAQGYQMYDPLRARLIKSSGIKPWYKYNTFVYVREGSLAVLHQALATHIVPVAVIPSDVSPLVYRLRKQLTALLPTIVKTALARLKKTFFNNIGIFR